MKKQDLEQIQQVVRETVKEELIPIRDELNVVKDELGVVKKDNTSVKEEVNYIKQKITANHAELKSDLKDTRQYLEQKIQSNHQIVMAKLEQIKKMETEDVTAFAEDVKDIRDLKRRVTKLEKVVYS